MQIGGISLWYGKAYTSRISSMRAMNSLLYFAGINHCYFKWGLSCVFYRGSDCFMIHFLHDFKFYHFSANRRTVQCICPSGADPQANATIVPPFLRSRCVDWAMLCEFVSIENTPFLAYRISVSLYTPWHRTLRSGSRFSHASPTSPPRSSACSSTWHRFLSP